MLNTIVKLLAPKPVPKPVVKSKPSLGFDKRYVKQ